MDSNQNHNVRRNPQTIALKSHNRNFRLISGTWFQTKLLFSVVSVVCGKKVTAL